VSGIVGIVHRDGAPVDRELLGSMTSFMAFRGPDAQEVWLNGSVGLGHAMLRTTFEQAHETQPCSLDGQVWVTADARIDGRSELKAELAARGQVVSMDATDVGLILHAYAAWGEACVEHLLGDFAFAIWDGRERKLFCARDHFGVKLFYYVQDGPRFLFSNTLNCLRQHPAVSAQLNELAIGDFLLFGYNQDPATTTFSAIRQLPPAHTLTWQDGHEQVRRYWTLPIEAPIRSRRPEEYVQRFKQLFWQAVADRLRIDRVGVFMSGGMDSTAVAAVAKGVMAAQNGATDICASTVVYDRLIPDDERYWSGLAAQHLGIDIDYVAVDGFELYQGWGTPECEQPEPCDEPLLAVQFSQFRRIRSSRRVVLGGHGGDPVLYPSRRYLLGLIETGQLRRLVSHLPEFVTANRRLPRILPTLKKRVGLSPKDQAYPGWLNPSFEKRLRLADRWNACDSPEPSLHPEHPEACEILASSLWPELFRSSDPGVTSFPVEVRQPFFDLRLVSFLLAIPPVPWCENKAILRRGMSGTLPDKVRLRPKAPLGGDPFRVLLAPQKGRYLDTFRTSPTVPEFVDKSKYLTGLLDSLRKTKACQVRTSPFSLAYWLESR
jgi:asparagine synthase (glutamine-hydrolysing)